MATAEKSLLVIDDEKRMTDSLRDLLGFQGYEVTTANSGADGIERIKERHFPVVITDLRMQDVDGLQVIKYVNENSPRTLVIVITGYASTESAIEAVHYHVFDYIRKPFEFDQIKAVIESAFHRLEIEQLREDTAAMITHDIKVPLTSILGFSSMIYDEKKDEFHPRGKEFASMIRSGARKILALVENYLTTAQAEAETLTADPRRTPLALMIEELREVISTEVERRGFSMEVDLGDSPEEVMLDETLIYRAVGNLLQNAVKYGDPSRPIRLGARVFRAEDSPLEKEALEIEVVNFAPGIAIENFDDLFDRYTRASGSVGVEGSGIGLYVVRAVALAHGGIARGRNLEDDCVGFSIVIPLDLTSLADSIESEDPTSRL